MASSLTRVTVSKEVKNERTAEVGHSEKLEESFRVGGGQYSTERGKLFVSQVQNVILVSDRHWLRSMLLCMCVR